jgi:hypothetical protein
MGCMPAIRMSPDPASRVLRFVGDRIAFACSCDGHCPTGWRAFVRTNLGRAAVDRVETVASLAGSRTFAGSSWRDIPLHAAADGWHLDLPLTEVGWFRAKTYLLDPEGRQHWPDGDDAGIAVHPDQLRTANAIYCAFPRMFGPGKAAVSTRHAVLDEQLAALDRHGYTVIPPSGTLRDLAEQLPHIVGRLGCTVLHLLPVSPTPTTYARFGRFGSPYACEDLTAIDPALVVFDQKTTAVDQFRELAYAAHLRGCRLFLDIVVNHTGWGSTLQNAHPEWFQRNADGTFHSPGAWGNTWADLVELEHHGNTALWEEIAKALLVWCQRGVDGFRCDAGYMVPLQAWRYIISRVRQEFPETVFLLEGLGGGWADTAALLTTGGMQWAYSELFQNYQGAEVARYLDHFLAHRGLGVLVHYSETHDNDRLAKGGVAWSLLRNRLCALTSDCGAFGFTAGVEWLATEKLEVHQARGLSWDAPVNLCGELATLNRLLSHHPCFFDGARLTRLSAAESAVYALRREDAEGLESLLVVANTDLQEPRTVVIPTATWQALGAPGIDLLDQTLPSIATLAEGVALTLAPAAVHCLGAQPLAHDGDAYRVARAQASWAYGRLAEVLAPEHIGPAPWRALAVWTAADPVRFLAALARLDPDAAARDLLPALEVAATHAGFPEVVRWDRRDVDRVVPVPPGHRVLIKDASPFSVTLERPRCTALHVRSVPMPEGHIAALPPAEAAGEAVLLLERYASEGRQARGTLRFLSAVPDPAPAGFAPTVTLLTNGLGGMARLGVDFGTMYSKYDCALGANLHASAPCDRHVLVKRVRAWLNADGFITPLDGTQLDRFQPGPPAQWSFTALAGDGRTVRLDLVVDMLAGRNTTVLRFVRPDDAPARGRDLPDRRTVKLILRVDCEDRSFHAETIKNDGAGDHFRRHTAALNDRSGFAFTPASDRRLRAWANRGVYHPGEEWCTGLPHPVEATRGMRDSGDAWSPGWFEIPIVRGEETDLVLCADAEDPPAAVVKRFVADRFRAVSRAMERPGLENDDGFGRRLAIALDAFVVRRGEGRTVIAGYPWFLDWGRDTFICCRGLLAAGMSDEVKQICLTFARFEQGGTLPNLLNGDHAENRDTVDAPLWFALVCAELADELGPKTWQAKGADGRSLAEVCAAIATGYLRGTANGIRTDRASALIWSPPHFTWMDTNYPTGTPRQGYAVEIQALWIRLLHLCDLLKRPAVDDWGPWTALNHPPPDA